jgi:hypothetical protein
MVLAIANALGLESSSRHSNCILNATLEDEEIFMRVPDGMANEDNMVLRLLKSIYGLKQTSRGTS